MLTFTLALWCPGAPCWPLTSLTSLLLGSHLRLCLLAEPRWRKSRACVHGCSFISTLPKLYTELYVHCSVYRQIRNFIAEETQYVFSALEILPVPEVFQKDENQQQHFCKICFTKTVKILMYTLYKNHDVLILLKYHQVSQSFFTIRLSHMSDVNM